LDAQQLKDLMTFLLIAPLEPAALEATGPPAPRTRAEIEALRKSSQVAGSSNNAKPLHIVLAAVRRTTGRASTIIRSGKRGGRSCFDSPMGLK